MATTTQLRNAFKLLASATNFKEGDRVRIVRKFSEGELGCPVDYNDYMADYIGMEGTITEDDDSGTYEVCVDDTIYYWWPWFSLELVASSNLVTLDGCDYNAVVSHDGQTVDVGCQSIRAASILVLADKIREVQAAQPTPTRGRRVTKKKVASRRR